MINKTILLGNVGNAPEIRTVGDGKKVANFSVATSDGTTTEWHRIVAWNKLAEIVEKYITAGKQVFIEGSIKTRSYDADGGKRYVTEIWANSIRLLGKREEAQQAQDMHPETNDLPF